MLVQNAVSPISLAIIFIHQIVFLVIIVNTNKTSLIMVNIYIYIYLYNYLLYYDYQLSMALNSTDNRSTSCLAVFLYHLITDLLENTKLLRKKDKVKFVFSHLVVFSARTSW